MTRVRDAGDVVRRGGHERGVERATRDGDAANARSESTVRTRDDDEDDDDARARARARGGAETER